MNARERKRLNKLILFLENLEPKRFYFNTVVSQVDEKGCGTVCCAIGWTPAVFPRLAKWGPRSYGITTNLKGFTRERELEDYATAASKLFGLNIHTANNLFTPKLQRKVHPILPTCGIGASPKKVAGMLRKFLELWDAGLIAKS